MKPGSKNNVSQRLCLHPFSWLFRHCVLSQWCISDAISDAATNFSASNIKCDATTTYVPEGATRWRWVDATMPAFQTAPVTVAFVPEAEARAEVRVSAEQCV